MSHLRVIPDDPLPPSMFDGCKYTMQVAGFVLAPWAAIVAVWIAWRTFR